MCKHNLVRNFTSGILICTFCGMIFYEFVEEKKPPEHSLENTINTITHFSNMAVNSTASTISPYMSTNQFYHDNNLIKLK